jgi:hypothetical protein
VGQMSSGPGRLTQPFGHPAPMSTNSLRLWHDNEGCFVSAGVRLAWYSRQPKGFSRKDVGSGSATGCCLYRERDGRREDSVRVWVRLFHAR